MVSTASLLRGARHGVVLALLGFLGASLQGCGDPVEGILEASVTADPEAMECRLSYDTQRQVNEDAKEFTILAKTHCSTKAPAPAALLAASRKQMRRRAGARLSSGRRASRNAQLAVRGNKTGEEEPAEDEKAAAGDLILKDCRISFPQDLKCPNGRWVDEDALATWSVDCTQKEARKLVHVCTRKAWQERRPTTHPEHDPKAPVAGTPSRHYPMNLDPKLQEQN